MTDYKTMYERAVEFVRSLIRETNSKGEKILRLEAEIRELKAQTEELRFNPNHDPANGRFTSGNGVDISGESGIINNKDVYIHPDKINRFCLDPHGKHADDFFDVGYKEDDYEILCRDLIENYDYTEIVDIVHLEDSGVRFSIFMNLGVEKKKRFRTVWQKDTPNSVPRFITAHRED